MDITSSWLATYRNALYFGYVVSGASYVLVMNLDDGRLVYHLYDDGDPVEITAIRDAKPTVWMWAEVPCHAVKRSTSGCVT